MYLIFVVVLILIFVLLYKIQYLPKQTKENFSWVEQPTWTIAGIDSVPKNSWHNRIVAKMNYNKLKIGYHHHFRNQSIPIFIQTLQRYYPIDFYAFQNAKELYDKVNNGEVDMAFVQEDDLFFQLKDTNQKLNNIQFVSGLFPIHYFLLVDSFKIRSINDLKGRILLNDPKEYYSYQLFKYLLPFLDKYQFQFRNVDSSKYTPIKMDINSEYKYNDIQIGNRYDVMAYPSHYPSTKLLQIIKSFNTQPLDLSSLDLSLFLQSFPCYKMEQIDLQYLYPLMDKVNSPFIKTLSTNLCVISHSNIKPELISQFLENMKQLHPILAQQIPFYPNEQYILSMKKYYSTLIPMNYSRESTQFFEKLGYIQQNKNPLCQLSTGKGCDLNSIVKSLSIS